MLLLLNRHNMSSTKIRRGRPPPSAPREGTACSRGQGEDNAVTLFQSAILTASEAQTNPYKGSAPPDKSPNRICHRNRTARRPFFDVSPDQRVRLCAPAVSRSRSLFSCRRKFSRHAPKRCNMLEIAPQPRWRRSPFPLMHITVEDYDAAGTSLILHGREATAATLNTQYHLALNIAKACVPSEPIGGGCHSLKAVRQAAIRRAKLNDAERSTRLRCPGNPIRRRCPSRSENAAPL